MNNSNFICIWFLYLSDSVCEFKKVIKYETYPKSFTQRHVSTVTIYFPLFVDLIFKVSCSSTRFLDLLPTLINPP